MVLLLVVIYITFISLGLPDSVFGVAWPVVHLDFGVIESLGSIYTVIIAVTSGGVSFFAGSIIRRVGTGTVTAVSVFLTAISLLGSSFANNIYVLLSFSILGGLGAGAIDTGLNNFVSLRYKAIHMNLLHCFWGVGVTVSPLICAVFLKNGDWRGGYRTLSYIQFGIAIIVLASLFLWYKYDSIKNNGRPNLSSRNPKPRAIDAFKINGVVLSIGALGFYCAMEFLVGTWGASFLVNARNFNVSNAANLVALYYGGVMSGRLISGFASLKVVDKNLIRAGLAVALIGILILLFSKDSIGSAIGLFVIGLGFGPVFPSTLHAVPERFGKELSADITGFQMGGAYAIGLVVQIAFGYTAPATTFNIMPYVLLACCAIAFLLSELVNKRVGANKANPS